jgi:hypothetical protein
MRIVYVYRTYWSVLGRVVYCVVRVCIEFIRACGARCVLCIVYVHCVLEGLVHVGQGAYCVLRVNIPCSFHNLTSSIRALYIFLR